MENNHLCGQEKEIAVINSQLKNIFKQLDRHTKSYEQVQEMLSEIKVISTSLVTVCEEIKSVQANVDELKYKSVKRVDKITGYVLSATITGVVVFLLAQVGL